MAESKFFMRSRGRITGPYDVEGLRRLIRQGTLARIHEISSDRTTWSPAADFEELFPPRPTARADERFAEAPPESIGLRTGADNSADEPWPAAQGGYAEMFPAGNSGAAGGAAPSANRFAPRDDRYFYSQHGSTVGPVPMTVLRTLVQNGTLSRQDLVWRENAEMGAPAGQVPSLASLFGGGFDAAVPAPQAAAASPAARHAMQIAMRSCQTLSAVAGIVCGALILICMNLPWFSINDRDFWWWDLFHEPGNGAGTWAAYCTYLVMAGVALCIVSPLTRGVSRGIALVAISGTALVFLMAAFLGMEQVNAQSLGIAVPTALAALAGTCAFRALVPEALVGKVLLGICGGVSTLGLLTFGVMAASHENSAGTIQGAVAFGTVLASIGALAGVAAGVTAFIGLKPRFTPGLNQATFICALCGLVLPCVGVFIAMIGAFDMLSPHVSEGFAVKAQMFAVQALVRSLLTWAAVLAVLAVGLYELLLSAAAMQKQ